MFSTQEVVNTVKKAIFDQELVDDLSHCQLLDAKAKQLGLKSYHHLRTWLEGTPDELIEDCLLGLMKKICAMRLPSKQCAYYEFMMLPDGGIGYYSCFIGWDKHADDVRVPRPLHGLPTTIGLRKLAKHPIYVIESAKELSAWQWSWRATALIPEALAKETFPRSFNKEHLIDSNPPLHRVRSTSRYANNIVRD